jgi:hypothetical protein
MEEEKAVGRECVFPVRMRETQGDTYTAQNPATIVGPLSYKT